MDCDFGGTCDYACSGGTCAFDCDNGTTCNIDCSGGGCDVICDIGSTCNVKCSGTGAPCTVTCENGGKLESCTGNCGATIGC